MAISAEERGFCRERDYHPESRRAALSMCRVHSEVRQIINDYIGPKLRSRVFCSHVVDFALSWASLGNAPLKYLVEVEERMQRLGEPARWVPRSVSNSESTHIRLSPSVRDSLDAWRTPFFSNSGRYYALTQSTALWWLFRHLTECGVSCQSLRYGDGEVDLFEDVEASSFGDPHDEDSIESVS
jgi:hypothetical protein